MIMKIVYYGDPVLRKPGAVIREITPEICQFARDMIETMNHAQGVGLAAQQVGRALQLCVIDIRGVKDRPSRMWIRDTVVDPANFMPMVLINPEIEITKKKEVGTEGCLSFPGISAEIARGARVKVRALDLNGRPLQFDAAGLLGRAVQHEVDHLRGILFTDRMSAEDKKYWKDDIENIRKGIFPKSDSEPD